MMAITIEIATYIGAIAAVVAAIASVITLCPKAKLGIQRGRVTLPIKSAHNRYPHGSIVLTNKGRKVCHIDSLIIQPVCGIDFEIFIVSFEKERIENINPRGIESPLPIQPHQKNCTVYFKAKEVAQYQGVLPAELKLEIKFDCSKKTFSETLIKDGNRTVYLSAREN